MMLLSPTGNGPVSGGHYRAARGVGFHRGADFAAVPGQAVVAPMAGRVVSVRRLHGGPFGAVVIESTTMAVEIRCLEPVRRISGEMVAAGELIGYAQNAGVLHPCPAHIHVEILHADPVAFLEARA